MKSIACQMICLTLLTSCQIIVSAEVGGESDALKPNWWKGDDFSWVRGANYIPSYAVNDVTQWKDYDGDVIDRELRLATRLDLNSVRVWLQYLVYEHDPRGFVSNLEDFVSRCDKYGIRPMFVLFDGCFGADPALDATIWVANPGPRRMVKEHWPKLERYVEDVARPYIGDPRVLFWDVMNEPSSLGLPEVAKGNAAFAWAFARRFCDYVNDLDPTHPTTVGVGNHSQIPEVIDHVDVVTFHCYQPFEKAFDIEIARARELSGDKAVLITETTPTDMSQDPESTFRSLRKNHIGWYFFHLVLGKLPLTVTTSVFDAHGKVYWPDYVAAILGFTVPRRCFSHHATPLNGLKIIQAVEAIRKTPTSEDTYENRKRVAPELGRSLAWAGVLKGGAVKSAIQRQSRVEALLKEGKKAEAYKIMDENILALAVIAEKHGFFEAVTNR